MWTAKITERREDSTADAYRHWLDGLVLPQLGELRLYECDVAHIDAFFTRLEQARRTVKHEDSSTSERGSGMPRTRGAPSARSWPVSCSRPCSTRPSPPNPVRELERIESPKGHRKAPPRGLTAEERRLLLAFVDADKVAIGANLPDLIRFAIGSGLRVGELCAVRWMDLNLEGIPVVTEDDMRLVPVVAMRQNVYPVKGKGLAVHGGKTATVLRIVPLPELVTTRLRPRRHGDENPEWRCSPPSAEMGNPTYRWPSNVRRSVRAVREQVGLGWMTPHTWRRTLRHHPRRRDEPHRPSQGRP